MDFLHLTGLVSTSKVARGAGWGRWGGGRHKREGIFGYLWRIHTVVQQKGIQHCKAIILQFQNKLQNKVAVLVQRVSRVWKTIWVHSLYCKKGNEIKSWGDSLHRHGLLPAQNRTKRVTIRIFPAGSFRKKKKTLTRSLKSTIFSNSSLFPPTALNSWEERGMGS